MLQLFLTILLIDELAKAIKIIINFCNTDVIIIYIISSVTVVDGTLAAISLTGQPLLQKKKIRKAQVKTYHLLVSR